MTDITLVMPYYENPGMLREHYALFRALSPAIRDRLRVVIVDDGSPRFPARAEECDVPLQIWRIKKDIRWNQDAARNIGVRHAETNWVLLTDIDHLVPARTWNVILFRDWDTSVAYSFARVSAPEQDKYKPHPNSWMLSRELFNKSGGYDERFAGYYGTDGDFKVRLNAVASRLQPLKEYLIRVPRSVIPDASTTTYLRKQPEDRPTVDRLRKERDARREPIMTFRSEYERVV